MDRSRSAEIRTPTLEAIVDQFDLVLFDHPFSGRIEKLGLLLPIDDVLAEVEGGADAASYIGPALATYRWNDATWGVPVDGATMHAIYRSDLLGELETGVPRRWEEVVALARKAKLHGMTVGLANDGHHGFLAIGSLMYNLGAPWTTDGGESLNFDMAVFRECLDRLRQLSELAHPQSADWNAIALHDAMTSEDTIVYCPLTYGYATYGEADFGPRRLAFAGAPGLVEPLRSGTLVGGVAIGISAKTPHLAEAKHYLAFAAGPDVQTEIFARHNGQPARIEAWTDRELDARFNGYFSAVHESMKLAGIRPRFDGYGIFEKEAGVLVNRHLRGVLTAGGTIESMKRLVEATCLDKRTNTN